MHYYRIYQSCARTADCTMIEGQEEPEDNFYSGICQAIEQLQRELDDVLCYDLNDGQMEQQLQKLQDKVEEVQLWRIQARKSVSKNKQLSSSEIKKNEEYLTKLRDRRLALETKISKQRQKLLDVQKNDLFEKFRDKQVQYFRQKHLYKSKQRHQNGNSLNLKLSKSNESTEEKSQIFNFKFVKYLGSGTYAQTFLVQIIPQGYLVALKMIQKENFTKINMKDIIKQAKNQHKCDSEFICKIYGAFETNKYYVFVMEYAPDGTIQKQIENQQNNNSYFLQMLHSITLGIKQIHNKSIIHRDIKQFNVLRTFSVPKITDFGISKILNKNECTQTFAGTKGYMASQIIQKRPYNHSVDIYSLGKTFQNLYNQFVNKVNNMQMNQNQELVRIFKTYVQKQLLDLIKKCKSDDPLTRPNFQQIQLKLFQIYRNCERIDLKFLPWKGMKEGECLLYYWIIRDQKKEQEVQN